MFGEQLLQERRGRFGRHDIRRKLGEGGFGEVFLARDPLLQRDVVLKVPRPDWQDAESLIAEARVLARLSHPQVVQVLDAGRSSGRPYLVLEYVPGRSLEAAIEPQASRSRPKVFEPAAALALLRGPAEALDHAHEAGVLHRDFKPGNLLVPHEGPLTGDRAEDAGGLKVADFGLAALAARCGPTPTESGVGDPRYTAAEAWRGSPDRRSDVYSLAAVFFRLVSGSCPLPGMSFVDWLQAVGRPERLSLRELRPDLSSALSVALGRGLTARRHERPATAVALLDSLQAALDRRETTRRQVHQALGRIGEQQTLRSGSCSSCRWPISPRSASCHRCGTLR
jgi:serine/threonine protein kinase